MPIYPIIAHHFKVNGKKTKLQKGDFVRFIPKHCLLAFYRPSKTSLDQRIMHDLWRDKSLWPEMTYGEFSKLVEIISFASGLTAKQRPDLDKEELYYEFC